MECCDSVVEQNSPFSALGALQTTDWLNYHESSSETSNVRTFRRSSPPPRAVTDPGVILGRGADVIRDVGRRDVRGLMSTFNVSVSRALRLTALAERIIKFAHAVDQPAAARRMEQNSTHSTLRGCLEMRVPNRQLKKVRTSLALGTRQVT